MTEQTKIKHEQRPKATDTILVNREHQPVYTALVTHVDEKERTCLARRYDNNEMVEVPFHDIEKINDRFVISRLCGWRGSHPKTPLTVEVATKQQLEGRDQSNVLWDALRFMNTQATDTHHRLLIAHMNHIRSAVEELVREGGSNELSDMATLCLSQAYECEKRMVERGRGEVEDFFMKDYELRLKLLNMSQGDLRKILNEEGLKLLPEQPEKKDAETKV